VNRAESPLLAGVITIALAAVMVATAAVGFCPLYLPFTPTPTTRRRWPP